MLGITATKCMSVLEIEARRKHDSRSQPLIARTVKWLITRSPYPVISAGKWLKERSPFVARILQRYGVTSSSGNSGGLREFVPDPQRLALFRSKTRVRIDKARESLGYEPRFNLKSGMERTKKYFQWANPDG